MTSSFGRETHMMPRAKYAEITLAVAATKQRPEEPASTDTMNLRIQWEKHAIPRIYGAEAVR